MRRNLFLLGLLFDITTAPTNGISVLSISGLATGL